MSITETILRQRLADLFDSIEGWHAMHGAARQRYRQYVRHDIAAYRRARTRAMAAQSEMLRAQLIKAA